MLNINLIRNIQIIQSLKILTKINFNTKCFVLRVARFIIIGLYREHTYVTLALTIIAYFTMKY